MAVVSIKNILFCVYLCFVADMNIASAAVYRRCI